MLPQYFLSSFASTGFSVQNENCKIHLQAGSYVGFPTETILAIVDLQITLILPTEFRVIWPFGTAEEVRNRLLIWRPLRPSSISDRDDFG